MDTLPLLAISKSWISQEPDLNPKLPKLDADLPALRGCPGCWSANTILSTSTQGRHQFHFSLSQVSFQLVLQQQKLQNVLSSVLQQV